MSRILLAATMTLAVAMVPMQALSFGTGSLFPTVSYPEPEPSPVTRDETRPKP